MPVMPSPYPILANPEALNPEALFTFRDCGRSFPFIPPWLVEVSVEWLKGCGHLRRMLPILLCAPYGCLFTAMTCIVRPYAQWKVSAAVYLRYTLVIAIYV